MKTKKIPFNIERAKAGAKIVTRGGLSARITDYAIKDKEHPILGLVDSGFYETPETFTNKGRAVSNNVESDYDLFIEEEEEELEICDKNNDAICASADSRMCFKALQNTKPGEILASKDGADILIFKKVDNFEHFSSYYNIQGKPNYSWANRQFVPATEEQRDLLFQKMKEAGYKWDSDKKELKKIAPKFKVGDKVVLKCDNSLVGSITSVSLEGTYSVKFEDSRTCWYSEQELEPLHKVKKAKSRRMTNQELSWWLRDCPEEHREYSHEDGRYVQSGYYDYFSDDANVKVDDGILIRRNGGEWKKPIIQD